MTGEGAFASAVQIPLQPFTLVGATTRTGLLTAPLFSRFGHVVRLDFYPPEDLAQIVTAQRAAARRRRSTPTRGRRDRAPLARHAARRQPPPPARPRLRRGARHREDRPRARARGVQRLEIDEAGLDEMDRRYLRVIIDHYDGGPVGVETLAAALGEPRDTLEDVYEPFLIQQGYVGPDAARPRRDPQGVRGDRQAAAGSRRGFGGAGEQGGQEVLRVSELGRRRGSWP